MATYFVAIATETDCLELGLELQPADLHLLIYSPINHFIAGEGLEPPTSGL